MAPLSAGTRDVVVMGVGFFCIFSAFQTSTFFQEPLLSDLGYKALGSTGLSLVYTGLCLGTIAAPFVVRAVGLKHAMMLGGSAYILALLSLIHVLPPIYLLASFLNGFGGGILWTAQGQAMTACSTPETAGFLAGLFWAMMMASLGAGGVASLTLVPNADDISEHVASRFFVVLSVVAGVGVLSLLGLRTCDKKKPVGEGLEPGPLDVEEMTMAKVLRSMCWTLVDGRAIFVCIPSFFGGFELALWQGTFPKIMAGKDPRVDLPGEFRPHVIGYVLLAVCAAQVIGSVGLGKLSDAIGRKTVIVLGFFAFLAPFLLIYTNFVAQVFTPTIPAGALYTMLLGVGDSVINVQSMAVLGALYPTDATPAFALFYCSKGISGAVAYGLSAPMSLDAQFLLLALLLVVSTVSFLHADALSRRTALYTQIQ